MRGPFAWTLLLGLLPSDRLNAGYPAIDASEDHWVQAATLGWDGVGEVGWDARTGGGNRGWVNQPLRFNRVHSGATRWLSLRHSMLSVRLFSERVPVVSIDVKLSRRDTDNKSDGGEAVE